MVTYRCTLIAPTFPDAVVPISSFQMRLRQSPLQCYLSVVVPDILSYADTISDRQAGEITLTHIDDGTETDVLTANINSIRTQIGGRNRSGTIVAYKQITFQGGSTVQIAKPQYRAIDSGTYRYRANPIADLKPSDYAAVSGYEPVYVDNLSWYVSSTQTVMELESGQDPTKKIASIAAGATAAASFTAAKSSVIYENTILAHADLEAYYRLGETAGATDFADEVASADQAITGTPLFGQTTIIDGDTDGCVDLPTAAYGKRAMIAALAVVQGSVECWVNPNALGSSQYVVSFGDDSLNTHYIGALRITSGGLASVYLKDSLNTTEVRGTTTTMSIGSWYHVVVQSTGTAYEIYVNNVSQTLNVVQGSNDGTWIGDDSNIDNISIGVRHIGGSVALPFNGLVDEVALYSQPLTSGEVTQHYNAGIG